MTASSREIDRMVLESVSEDYQSFEAVVSKLSQFSDCVVAEIERILLSSIANNLVAAYLLHADPPYATEVGASSETIRRYWFCITEEGRRYLSQLTEKQTVAPRRASS
jgi:16S rRNA G966 N2-methylase RsmD